MAEAYIRNAVHCRDCGNLISPTAPTCPKCGGRQFLASASGGNRTRVAAALFAFFLGGLGIHKFYLGRTGEGVIYLIFCWTFIPAIVALIEGIIYLTMSDEEFSAKYG